MLGVVVEECTAGRGNLEILAEDGAFLSKWFGKQCADSVGSVLDVCGWIMYSVSELIIVSLPAILVAAGVAKNRCRCGNLALSCGMYGIFERSENHSLL